MNRLDWLREIVNKNTISLINKYPFLIKNIDDNKNEWHKSINKFEGEK